MTDSHAPVTSTWSERVRGAPAALLRLDLCAEGGLEYSGYLGYRLNGALGEGLRLLAAPPGHPEGNLRHAARLALDLHEHPREVAPGLRQRSLALAVPTDPLALLPGETLSVEMVLLGEAAPLWRAYVAAARELRLQLDQRRETWLTRRSALLATAAGPFDPAEIGEVETGVVTLGHLAGQTPPPPSGPLRLRFPAPLRLVQGRPPALVTEVANLEPLLVAAVQALSALAGSRPDRAEYLEWKQRAAETPVTAERLETVTPVRRQSGSGRSVDLSGVVGYVEVSELPEPLRELFALARFVHLGQHPGWGYGRFAWEGP